MPLLILPDEILNLIIKFYIPNDGLGRGFGYCSIQSRLQSAYRGLINLSSTCSALRNIVGKYLFLFVSLVRRSEIDSIMAYPRRMDGWSDYVEYRANFIRMLRSYNGSYVSYRKKETCTNIAGFVTRLEIPNICLTNGDLHLFPEFSHLSILAEPMTTNERIDLPPEFHLGSLSINIETLIAFPELIKTASGCTRLDLLCDFNFCNPDKWFPYLEHNLSGNNFKEINLFFSDSQALRYASVISFLGFILSSNIERLSLRLYKKTSGRTGPQFCQRIESPIESGLRLVGMISLSPCLKSLTMDLEMISRLDFEAGTHIPQRILSTDKDTCFTLVDYSLSVPKLLFRPREAVANLIQAMGAKYIAFTYGEVIDQAQLHALSVIRDLVSYLSLSSQRHTKYHAISMVFLEKAWSTSDDSSVRRHFDGIIDENKRTLPSDSKEADSIIAGVCSTQLPSFTSSRYRKREAFRVNQDCDPDGSWPMIDWGSSQGKDVFWSVETSLRDLEHYSARERALSSLWE